MHGRLLAPVPEGAPVPEDASRGDRDAGDGDMAPPVWLYGADDELKRRVAIGVGGRTRHGCLARVVAVDGGVRRCEQPSLDHLPGNAYRKDQLSASLPGESLHSPSHTPQSQKRQRGQAVQAQSHKAPLSRPHRVRVRMCALFVNWFGPTGKDMCIVPSSRYVFALA